MKKKILHIANWYPNKWDDMDALYIKKQLKVFEEVTDSYLCHVQVLNGEKILSYKHIVYSDKEKGYYFLTKFKSNKIIELLTTFLLLYVLIRVNYKKYDLLHFHIAYPLLTYYYIWKKIITVPIIISEHWSGYHFNFNMPKNTKKLNNIKKIFRQQIPLITVSKALLGDIQKFSNNYCFKNIVIPNIVDEKVFYYNKKNEINIPTFFIINHWSEIKNPFPMLKAFSKLEIDFILKIGGFGDFYEDIKKFIKNEKMDHKVIIFEKMTSKEIACELNSSSAYLFSSNYETFSIICAESLSCGCPIIGPRIPAIMEYTTKKNSVTFIENNTINWEKAIKDFLENINQFDRFNISKDIKKVFSYTSIQKKYMNFIKNYGDKNI